MAEAYKAAVGKWGVRPLDFWALHPIEFWWLYEVNKPQKQDLPGADLEELYTHMMAEGVFDVG